MKITANELGILNLILQLDKDNKARQFPLADLKKAMDIFEKIKENVEDEKFKDGEIELTSEEKVFLNGLIEERGFGVQDAKFVFDLQTKLK